MLVYRLASQRFNPLDGRGAELKGGRWNSRGIRCVYAAEHRSLAALEALVNLGSWDPWPADLALFTIAIPDDCPMGSLRNEDLPADWMRQPEVTRTRGDEWLRGGSSACLWVPSVMIPQERNLLINPAHADVERFALVNREPFRYQRSR